MLIKMHHGQCCGWGEWQKGSRPIGGRGMTIISMMNVALNADYHMEWGHLQSSQHIKILQTNRQSSWSCNGICIWHVQRSSGGAKGGGQGGPCPPNLGLAPPWAPPFELEKICNIWVLYVWLIHSASQPVDATPLHDESVSCIKVDWSIRENRAAYSVPMSLFCYCSCSDRWHCTPDVLLTA